MSSNTNPNYNVYKREKLQSGGYKEYVQHGDGSVSVVFRTAESQSTKTTVWNKVPMLRGHSYLSAARHIATGAEDNEFVSITMIGRPGSGKSTLARSLAHTLHEMLEERYNLHYTLKKWGLDELDSNDFDAFLDDELTQDSIILLDDISNAHKTIGRTKWDKVIQAMTSMRHRTIEVRVIIFYSFHYTSFLEKYLRGSTYGFLMEVPTNEYDNCQKTYKCRGETLDWLQNEIYLGRHFKEFGPINPDPSRDPDGKKRLYSWSNPFRPCLFYNGSSLRPMVYPSRKWLTKGKTCKICDMGKKLEPATIQDFERDLTIMMEKYGNTAPTALRAYLYKHGYSHWQANITSALRHINKELGHIPVSYIDQYLKRYKDTQRQVRKAKESFGGDM